MRATIKRKIRKQPTAELDPWNQDLEPGIRVYESDRRGGYRLFDLQESTGRNKRATGELTPRPVKPPNPDAEAIRIDGVWYWQWAEEGTSIDRVFDELVEGQTWEEEER